MAAMFGAVAALVARATPALADQTINDNLIIAGFCKVGGFFGANGAVPFGAAPMVLKQQLNNNGIVVTDQAGANQKDLFLGFDIALTHAYIQGVQQNVAFLDTAINPSGGNVGIRTSAPLAPLHVAGAAQVDGALSIGGNLTVQGTKSRAVQTATHGIRKLYAIEAPDNWFEDIGWAALTAGQVRVNLDPIFAETIDTRGRYAVFVTPLGNCNGLYVSALDATGFEVHELLGGTSNVDLQYRVVAKAQGLEAVRLTTFTPVSGPRRGN